MEEEGKIFQILSPQSKHRARELCCTVGKNDVFCLSFYWLQIKLNILNLILIIVDEENKLLIETKEKVWCLGHHKGFLNNFGAVWEKTIDFLESLQDLN